LQESSDASPKLHSKSRDSFELNKELVKSLKAQWKLLWNESFNDKARAENVSVNDYVSLQVERGTIICATRDFKELTFREILEATIITDQERFQTNPQTGGWNKFVKTEILNGQRKKQRRVPSFPTKIMIQRPKKGGRGWLHVT